MAYCSFQEFKMNCFSKPNTFLLLNLKSQSFDVGSADN